VHPEGGVGGGAFALLALVVVTALGLAFAALAAKDEPPVRPAVVTVERTRTQPPPAETDER